LRMIRSSSTLNNGFGREIVKRIVSVLFITGHERALRKCKALRGD